MRINLIDLMKAHFNIRLGHLLLYLLFMQSFAIASEPLIQVTAEVDKSVITIGDRITYSLIIVHDKNLHIEQPGPGANLGQFEIKDYNIAEPVESEKVITQRFDYEISVFDTGTFVIPPFPVAFAENDTGRNYQIIQSEPLEIRVNSVLSAEDRELRDIKPPQEVPVDYWKWVLWSGGVLATLLVMLIIYYILQRRRKGLPLFRKEIIRPAHEIAMEELAVLRQEWPVLWEQNQAKEIFTRLSNILRKYLENRFFIKALEETTFEIGQSLTDLDLETSDQETAAAILAFSDLVKFAKYQPEQNEINENINRTQEFIDATRLVFEAVENVSKIDGDQLSGQTEDQSQTIEEPSRNTN